MHLDEERLERLLHGELPPGAEASVREHLAACADCRAQAAEARREEEDVHGLLLHLDHPAPPVDAGSVAARTGSRDSGWVRWAAGIALALGAAGAAYAAPGSPVPGWVGSVVEWVAGSPQRSPPAPAPTQAGGPGTGGLAVVPGEELLILFTSRQQEGGARVSLTDEARVVVRALDGSATFTSDVDRLLIHNEGSSADFQVRIPWAAPRVEIRVAGRPVFLKEGPRITTEAPEEPGGPYVLPLTGPGP